MSSRELALNPIMPLQWALSLPSGPEVSPVTAHCLIEGDLATVKVESARFQVTVAVLEVVTQGKGSTSHRFQSHYLSYRAQTDPSLLTDTVARPIRKDFRSTCLAASNWHPANVLVRRYRA